MKNIAKILAAAFSAAAAAASLNAQSMLYPQHFDLSEVELLEGPLKRAMELNCEVLLQYDADRLLTPFMRQAGFEEWEKLYPNFPNWGSDGFRLDGHIGGHYLSALAMAYSASRDEETREKLLKRLGYMVDKMAEAQSAFDGDENGLRGYVGGIPCNELWTQIYSGVPSWNVEGKFSAAVPLYVMHKIFAGFRDAYAYAGNQKARECFRKLCDWGIGLVSNLDDAQLQGLLNMEHGGMNEVYADAYLMFGDKKYLDAAKRFSHRVMIDGMQSPDAEFLSGMHANTQVPKYVGFARIADVDALPGDAALMEKYRTAAENFWEDVARNRTLSFGGNSVDEHFLHAGQGMRYIENPNGPESCNTYNMLKLSEGLFSKSHLSKYADFYEKAMINHILSTQNPNTGGYVYFTSVRPRHYRMYSQVNKAMWCCVGTGMENHSKYAHFAYTHDGGTLYVNLFIPSRLKNGRFALTQATEFPYSQKSLITIDSPGSFEMAIRRPQWCEDGFRLKINGAPAAEKAGPDGYARLRRDWKKGDRIEIFLPMSMRLLPCPTNEDYVAFAFGPVALGAIVGTEDLKGQFAEEGRMDHAPSLGRQLDLTEAPILIGDREKILKSARPADPGSLRFKIAPEFYADKKYAGLVLQPFFTIHEARYMIYFYQPSAKKWAADREKMREIEREKQALERRTLDFVSTGEQQSDAGHERKGPCGSGEFAGERYVDAWTGGWFSYELDTRGKRGLSIMCRFFAGDGGRKCTISVNGKKLKDFILEPPAQTQGFFDMEIPVPDALLGPSKTLTVRFDADKGTPTPGLYFLRLLSK